tara:strand:- start:2775 stop:4379 length:1605 start_codon:yes stop_codon:yes gene_type:complete
MSDDSAAVWMGINDLVPWDENPRKNEAAISEVANSIKRFGFASPIIANKENQIIAGHTRWEAAKSLNLEKVPVRVMPLDPVDSKLLAIADNRIGEIAEWDDQRLSSILSELKEQNHDVDGLGFNDSELADLIKDLNDPLQADPEPKIAEPQPKIIDVSGQIIHTDCIKYMNENMEENSINAIVCDPPYGIGFMGKGWDCSVPSVEWAKACYRVLKPGGHIIAFGGTRTIHRLTVAVEDAGFEIRDMIAWCQYQGFPKSLNISKQIDDMAGVEREVIGTNQNVIRSYASSSINYSVNTGSSDITKPATEDAIKWSGFGTGLKPTYEPAILARKPISEKNIASQVLLTGTGAINIDGCRFQYGDNAWIGPQDDPGNRNNSKERISHTVHLPLIYLESHYLGRFPANVYQCPKPSRAEKEAGCDGLESVTGADAVQRKEGSAGLESPRAGAGRTAESVKNNHPTVKPLGVMRWLCRLVGGQPGSVILDPFAGSGTTGCASLLEGFNFIGLEQNLRYCEIARARLSYWSGTDGKTDQI